MQFSDELVPFINRFSRLVFNSMLDRWRYDSYEPIIVLKHATGMMPVYQKTCLIHFEISEFVKCAYSQENLSLNNFKIHVWFLSAALPMQIQSQPSTHNSVFKKLQQKYKVISPKTIKVHIILIRNRTFDLDSGSTRMK